MPRILDLEIRDDDEPIVFWLRRILGRSPRELGLPVDPEAEKICDRAHVKPNRIVKELTETEVASLNACLHFYFHELLAANSRNEKLLLRYRQMEYWWEQERKEWREKEEKQREAKKQEPIGFRLRPLADGGRILIVDSPAQAGQLLSEISAEITKDHERSVHRMGEVLQKLENKDFGFEENLRIAKQIQLTIQRIEGTLACPTCGNPSNLRYRKSGRQKSGFFQFDHYIDGKRTSHGGYTSFPPMKISQVQTTLPFTQTEETLGEE